MKMKAGQIILPTMRNDGTTSLAKTHERLAMLLIAAFNGCTAVPGSGMYNNPGRGLQVEAIYQYTVAYEPSAHNDFALRAIAKTIGAEAGQDSVYVEYAGGEVEFVGIPTVAAPPLAPVYGDGVLPTEITLTHDRFDFHQVV